MPWLDAWFSSVLDPLLINPCDFGWNGDGSWSGQHHT